MIKYIKQFLILLACIFIGPVLYAQFNSNDDLDSIVDDLAMSLGVETATSGISGDTIYIKDIRIQINGTTSENWVRSRLFITKGQNFTSTKWRNVAKKQADYFLETGLFYNANVYLLPYSEPGQFICVVELTDGFMYAFNFWPWDVSVAFKHLLNGNELLEITLGPTTQRINWSHPIVQGTPFSYRIAVGHLFREHKSGWLEDCIVSEASLYGSFGPWFDMGFDTEFRYYSLPTSSPLAPDFNSEYVSVRKSELGLGDSGVISKIGLFAEIWPNYRFMQPLGYNLRLAGGAVLPESHNLSWYAQGNMRLYIRPLYNIVGALHLSGYANGPNTSPIIWPNSEMFRSPILLETRPTFIRTAFQLTLLSLIAAPLGFTTMSINPYAFIETAGTFDRLSDFSMNNMHWSSGGAVAIGFSYPVDLYFSFGLKQAIDHNRGMGFYFSVDTDLY